MDQFYLASDSILLLASDNPQKLVFIDQLDDLLRVAGIVTSSYSLLEANRVFRAKQAGNKFKSFLWTIRPLFDAILDFTEEDLERADALQSEGSIPERHAIEAALVLNHGIAGILSSSEKFDWIATLRRIPVSL
jgi:hypothetical protein